MLRVDVRARSPGHRHHICRPSSITKSGGAAIGLGPGIGGRLSSITKSGGRAPRRIL